MPINKSNIPPAVLKAGKDMPKCDKKNSPKIAKENNMIEAISTPRMAIFLLDLESYSDDSAANTAATSIGPIVAKNVARATIAVSKMTSVINFLH